MKIKKKFEILTYNVGFINKALPDVLKNGLEKGDIHWMKHKYKDRFFADPFLINENKEFYFVLCEEYTFWEEKGKISLLKVRKDNYHLESKKIIIEEDYHLSFPACFFGGNTIKPEASKSNKYYEYVINTNDYSIIEKKKILDEGTIDAIEYTNNKATYLLTGKINNPSGELYMYIKENNDYGNSKGILVKNGKNCSRNAGNIFEWNGELYRPVQDCSERYGKQTKIMKVKEINKNKLHEEEIISLNSFLNSPYNETMHTFNVYDKFILVDGSKDFLRFPMKIFYRKFSFLFKKNRGE